MNWRRYLLAAGAAILLSLVADVLINAVIMRQAFVDGAEYWLPADELNRRVPLGFAALAGSLAVLGLAFVRLGRVGVRAGLEFGGWLALATAIGVLGLASLVPWPSSLILSMAIQQAVNNLLLGFMFGWLYRPAPAAAASHVL